MVKILDYKTPDIPLSKLKDGQIAVITSWVHKQYLGLVIQRYHNDLFMIGKADGWNNFDRLITYDLNRVRILPKGTKFEII
jgi:hypothetical protein